MSKKTLAILVTFILALSCIIFAACGEKDGGSKVSLTGFDVPETEEVYYGTNYTLPEFTVKDKNGKLYMVEYQVTNGGEPVTVVGGQISIDKMSDYTIVFSVKINDTETVKKTMTLTVTDGNEPTVTIEGLKAYYLVGENIAVPEITIRDNIDTDIVPEISVYSGEEVVVEKVQNEFTINEAGKYSLVVKAVDSSGNTGEGKADFVVRNTPAKGEIEDFEDELASFGAKALGNYGENLQSENGEIEGQTAWRVSSVDATNVVSKYPGVSILPRLSLDEVKALKEEGFNAITMNIYLDHTATRTIYHQWAMKSDGSGHQQTNLGAVKNGEWTTVSFDLDLFISAYEDIASGEILLFYFGNEADYTVDKISADFDFYIKDIYITKTLTDISITNQPNEFYDLGSEVDLSTLTASSASAQDAKFKVEVFDPQGTVLVPENGKITVDANGMYTVKVSAEQKCYLGSVSVNFTVLPDLATVNSYIEEILAAEDMQDPDIVAKATLLKGIESVLSNIEGYETIDMIRYYAAANLTKLEDGTLMYFASGLGKDQISTSYVADKDPEKALTTKNAVVLDTVNTYEGLPTTKIGFDDVNGGKELWVCPFYVTFAMPAKTDLSGYSHIRFALRGYSNYYGQDRPMEYAVLYNGKRFIEPTVLTTGEWTLVTIDLAANNITDLSKLKLAFYTKNGNDVWGSVGNKSEWFYVNISNVYGIIAVDDIAISSEFTYQETYDLGDTLDLSKFIAQSETYPDLTYSYYLVYNGVQSDLPASITFEDPGQYVLKAVVSDGDYSGQLIVTIKVNGSEEKPTVELINETIQAVLTAPDKSDEEVIRKSQLLEGWLENLESVYGYEDLDMFEYYAAMRLTEIKDGTLMYFGTELGKDQVTLQYNKNVPVETKNGLTVDTETLCNGQPTTKIEFTDVTGWFSPYLMNFTYASSEDLSKYSVIRFYLKGYSGLSGRPLEYAMLYNGKRFIQPTALTNGEWTEITIDLAANSVTDLSKLTLAFYSLNKGDIWGSITAENNYFYAHISAVYGIVSVDDLAVSESFVYNETYNVGDTLDLSGFAVQSATYPDLTYSYYLVYNGEQSALPANITFETAGVYTFKGVISSEGYTGEISIQVVVSDPDATLEDILFADANADLDEIVARGYGADKTANSYVADFNGRDAVMAQTDPNASSSSSNSFKWPGVDIHSAITKEQLEEYKLLGYNTLIIPIYITNTAKTIDVKYGPNGGKIASIAPDGWVEMEIPIDTLISSYDSTLSDYFIYIDNGASGDYITYYIGDIYLVA